MLSSVWADPEGPRKKIPVLHRIVDPMINGVDRMMDFLHRHYERLVNWIFLGARVTIFRKISLSPRGAIVGLAIFSFVLAIALIPAVGTEFVPKTDQGFTQISVRLPVSTSLARGDEKIQQVEGILRTIPEVETLSTSIGGAGSGFLTGRTRPPFGLS